MGKRKGIRIVGFLFVCMFFAYGIGGRAERKSAVVEKGSPEEGEKGASAENETQGKAIADGGKQEKQIVLENANIKETVYRELGKQTGSPLYESELQGLDRKLELTGIVSLSSGGDLDFIRAYCELDRVYEWEVVFQPDLQGWTEEQLDRLGDLKQTVKINGTEGTVPARVLPCFKGTSELIFEANDVAGRLPEGEAFPKQVKSVALYQYSNGKYRNLLKSMWGSEVEELSIYNGSQEEGKIYFRLDLAAGMNKLKYLNAAGGFLRIQDAESLEGMELRELCGTADRETGFAFLEIFPGLEKVTLAVAEEMDLEPLLAKEGLALRLVFCQEAVEFEEDIFTGEGVVVCGGLTEELGWKDGKEAEGNFLAIYQRYMDEGRKIECFSIRGWDMDEGMDGIQEFSRGDAQGDFRENVQENSKTDSLKTARKKMYNVRTFLRVTDGEWVYVLDPRDGERGFGSYQRDYVSMEDINFDGVKDITLDMGSFGNQCASYEAGWIWDRERGEYIHSNTYHQIINPRVDSKHKLVRSSWRNSAASHSWAIYRYENGEFAKKSELTEELLYGNKIPEDMEVPENAEVWQWVEEIYENGKVAETRSFVIAHVEGEAREYPEAYEKFYEEDSYWG